MLRILQVTGIGQHNGIANVVLNWHKNLDRTKIQFDYLEFIPSKNSLKKEIEILGGNTYLISYNGIFHLISFARELYKFFRKHKYNIIHCHMIPLSFLLYPIAKFCGVKNIFHHSHNPKYSDKFLNELRNRLLFFFARPFITKKLACSDIAGKFMFRKSYTVINNGINIEKFKFNEDIRIKMRKELNIEKSFVIGNAGRFVEQKNHRFLIDVFNEIYKQDKNSVLLLVGDGSLKSNIEQQVEMLKLKDNVIFLGVRRDIERIYQALDCFVLPSNFEGLGIVAIEAQCSGLPCFISDGVPEESMICNTTKIQLSNSAKEWADIILEKTKKFERADCSEFIKQTGYDIKETTKKIQEIYLSLSGNGNG